MFSLPRFAGHSFQVVLACFVVASTLAGCSRQKSDTEAVDQFFLDNPKAKRQTIGKFAGHVTIDGMPPDKAAGQLFVLLNDAEHPVRLPPRFVACNEDGTFAFTTYLAGDGVPVGKYVIEFAQLKLPRGGRGRAASGVARMYGQPDGLKNLYSDPEKNLSDPNLIVTVESPGRTDYEFNLQVAGKDAIAAPGKLAAVSIPTL